MLVMTGYPCPTCGMTTAFAHAVRGQLWRAFCAQPAGLLLALAAAGGVGVAAWVLIRGRWPVVFLPWLTPHLAFWVLLLVLLGGWVFKIVLGRLAGAFPAAALP
jgi:hypothetical protein